MGRRVSKLDKTFLNADKPQKYNLLKSLSHAPVEPLPHFSEGRGLTGHFLLPERNIRVFKLPNLFIFTIANQ